MDTTSEKKGWSILILKKTAVLIPYIISLAYILVCGMMIVFAADMFRTSVAEMDVLIEAGDLPMCVKMLPVSLATMIIAAGMLLIRFNRRRR